MSTRPIRVEGDIAFVPLTQGYEAIIDAADISLVSARRWHAVVVFRANGQIRTVYASRTGKSRKAVRLHWEILGKMDGLEVDHIDGNGLNNRRDNLRMATKAQNQHNCRMRSDNSSGFKGVSPHKQSGKWRADIKVNGARKYLGIFATPESASEAYAAASKERHGNYGRVE